MKIFLVVWIVSSQIGWEISDKASHVKDLVVKHKNEGVLVFESDALIKFHKVDIQTFTNVSL